MVGVHNGTCYRRVVGKRYQLLEEFAVQELPRVVGMKALSRRLLRYSRRFLMRIYIYFLLVVSVLLLSTGSNAQVNWIRNGVGGGNLVFSPDGTKLASENGTRVITVWDLQTLKPRTIFDIPNDTAGTSHISFTTTGDSIYVSRANRLISYVWDITNSRIVEQSKVVSIQPAYDKIAYHQKRFAYWGVDKKAHVIFTGDASAGITDSLVGQGNVTNVEFFPSGNRLSSLCNDSTIRIWDLPTKSTTAQIKIDDAVPSSTFVSDPSNVVCVVSTDSSLRVFDASDGSLKYQFPEKFSNWWHVQISPSSYAPIAALFIKDYDYYQDPRRDSMVTILDLATGAVLAEIRTDRIVWSVAFSHDRMAVGLDNGSLLLYSTSTWQLVDTLAPEGHAVSSLAFSKKTGNLLSAGGRMVLFVDPATGSLNRVLHPYRTSSSLSISPSEKYLATDGYIWDVENDKQAFYLQTDRYGEEARYNIQFITDSTFFYLYRKEGHWWFDCGGGISCGKIVSDDSIYTIPSIGYFEKEFISAMRIPGTMHVAGLLQACDVYKPKDTVWLAVSSPVCGGDTTFTYASKYFYGTSMAFNSTGTRMLTASSDSLYLWDLTDGELLSAYIGHSGACKPIGFSHNGIYFFSYGLVDSSIRVWEAGSGVNVKTYKPYLLSPSVAALAPDGRNIIAGYRDGTLLSLYIGDALSAPSESAGESGLHISCIPNPVTHNSVISFHNKRSESAKIELYNSMGAKVGNVFEGIVSNEPLSILLGESVKLRTLSSGVYFLTATTPQHRRSLVLHLVQ